MRCMAIYMKSCLPHILCCLQEVLSMQEPLKK